MTDTTADATAVLIAVIIAAGCKIVEIDYADMGEIAEWRLGLVRKGQKPICGRALGAADLGEVLRKGARWAMGTEPLQDTDEAGKVAPGGAQRVEGASEGEG